MGLNQSVENGKNKVTCPDGTVFEGMFDNGILTKGIIFDPEDEKKQRKVFLESLKIDRCVLWFGNIGSVCGCFASAIDDNSHLDTLIAKLGKNKHEAMPLFTLIDNELYFQDEKAK